MVALWSVQPRNGAAADDLTPTPLPSSPQPTPAAVATIQTEPTVAVEATFPPTLEPTLPPPRAERLAPPTAIPPPAVRIEQFPTPTPTPNPSPVQIVPPSPVSAPPPSEVPLPSPDELRASARLRWGKHVPAAVRRWAFLIVPAARRYHLSPNLIAAVMTMESGGDPIAWSSADARGLMQILHGPWDPRQNVFEGARMLAALYARFGDWSLALAGYNAGPDAVVAYNGIPPYRETRDYVIIVQYLWDLFDHRPLTVKRKALYRRTLRDLQRFADQRKKVARLATVAHVEVLAETNPGRHYLCRRFGESCNAATASPTLFPTLDPFWPLGDVPDPLLRVDPYSRPPSPTR